MGIVKCSKHGYQPGIFSTPNVCAGMSGIINLKPAEIRPIAFSFYKDLTHNNQISAVFDISFLANFGLKEGDTALYLDDQDERHLKLAEAITLVCYMCINEFLEKNGINKIILNR